MADNDFKLAGLADQSSGPGNFDFSLGQAVNRTTDSLAGTAANAEAAKSAQSLDLTFNPTKNTFVARGDSDLLRQVMGKAQQFDTIQQNYNEMLARNEARQAQMREHPFANTLAQLAASFAANDPNPYTRAIGQAAQRLNPTQQELERQQMAILQQKSTATGREMAADIAALRTEITAMTNAQRLALDQQRLTNQANQAVARDLAGIERNAAASAMSGKFDAESYVAERMAAGDTPTRAQSSAVRLKNVNDASIADEDYKRKREDAKDAATTRRLDQADARFDELVRHNQEMEAQGRERLEKALDKQVKMPEKEKKEVRDLVLAKTDGQKLLEIFDPKTTNPDYKRAQQLMGPFRGRFTEWRKWFGSLNPEEAGVVNRVMKQFANTVNSLGTGTYGYRISERGFVQDFTEAMKNNPGQNYGNLKNWLEWYDQKLNIIAAQYGVPVSEFEALSQAAVGKGPAAKTPSGKPGGSPASKGTPRFDANGNPI